MRGDVSFVDPIVKFLRLKLFDENVHAEVDASAVAITGPASFTIFDPSETSQDI